MHKDSWNPQQYQKFSKERELPFYDLMKMISVRPNMSVVDLGCGTGHLTKILHETLGAKKTLGIDSSATMLKDSKLLEGSGTGLQFKQMDIDDFNPTEKYDLIFSNAALQWIPNHVELFARLSRYLSKQGQIAIQMPSNFDYPTHTIAKELAQDKLFKEQLGTGREPSVLSIEEYSLLLYRLGFEKQIVRLQVYPHILESTESIVEWVKGSLLTYYQSRLSPDLYNKFVAMYQERIISHFGDVRPFFMPFKRILIWAGNSE